MISQEVFHKNSIKNLQKHQKIYILYILYVGDRKASIQKKIKIEFFLNPINKYRKSLCLVLNIINKSAASTFFIYVFNRFGVQLFYKNF